MRFILVRERKTGKILRRESINGNAYPSVEALGSAVARKIIDYEKQFPFPQFEVISGTADTIEEFEKDFPEPPEAF